MNDSVAGAKETAGVFLAASQRAPLLALLQGLERGESPIVITGETGVGKTTLLDSVLPSGQSGGTQRIWCRSEGGEQFARARVLLEAAARNLEAETPAQGRRTIVVVDDAHLLAPEEIGHLVGFLDLAGAGSGRLQLVLVGRPVLWTRLGDAKVVDRVRIVGEFTGLPPSEAREYLRERLEPAGTPIDDILTDDARLALLRRGRWTPAELDAVMSYAGGVLPGQGAGWITREIVEQVALLSGAAIGEGHLLDDHLTGEPGRSGSSAASRLRDHPRLARRAAMAAALLAVLASGAFYWSWTTSTPAARLVAERTPPPRDSRPSSEPELSQASAPSPARQRPQSVAPAAKSAAAAASGTVQDAARPTPNEHPKGAAKLAANGLATTRNPRAAVQAKAGDLEARNQQRSALTMPLAQIDEIFRRGEAMLARGDVSAARVLYKRAAKANSGAAATIVGKTYDPMFLAGIGAATIKPAPSRAAAWYLRAAELGDKEGQDRLAQLRSWTSQVAGND